MKVRVRGIEQLQRKLGALGPAVTEAARRELLSSGLRVVAGAKRRAPVDTGRLRNSITFEVTADGDVVRVGTNLEYAAFQEFGTRKMPARPFLFPAFEEERPRLRERMQRAIEAAAAKVAKGR